MSFIAELKRRHVFKAGVAYIIVAWLILQVTDVVLGGIDAPDWLFKAILFVLIIGFPLNLLLAWAYDLAPNGLKRSTPVTDDPPHDDTVPLAEEIADTYSKASVAVLPFVNMSGNEDNEYFSDGLSEELLNALSKIPGLKVAARTSSFHFKGHTGDIAGIAQQLSVGSILEGSVRQSGNRIRITAQLINAHDGYHLWSEKFDRELDDIFHVQDEIANSVAKALKVKLLGETRTGIRPGSTDNPEAFNAYLRGMHYRNRGSNETALRDAVSAYKRAIELDPEYAQAYAGLAGVLLQLATNNFAELDEVVDQAYEAARKSVELAPELADPYPVLATIALNFRLDKQSAQEAIDMALRLDPGNARVHIRNASIGFCSGDFDASLASARIARELDPVSANANQWLGHTLYFARRYDEAIEAYYQALELDPDFPRLHYGIGMCRFMLGDTEAAASEIAEEPLDWMRLSGTAILQEKLGNQEEAKAAMAAMRAGYRDNGLYQQAQVLAQWGDSDEALKALNRAREIGDPGISQIVADPLLDPLREEPGFQDLMRTIGFSSSTLHSPGHQASVT